jgi:hypothetical protein
MITKTLVLLLSFTFASFLVAQEPSRQVEPAKPNQQELEKKFQEQLTNCEFVGRWCLVENGRLGEEKEERYSITSARKASGELWIIQARVQYGDKDVTIPVPVHVKWAGDTPVITLTDAAIPNLGTYSARVLVYKDSYAGTWSGGNHGGMLHGVIRKKEITK